MTAAYQINGQSASAQAFYQLACNPQRHVAVEACAGAGKTWMLVSRMVRALLESADAKTGELNVLPHEILAITFTKRAAGEMRERLIQWLADFAHADAPTLARALRDRGVDVGHDEATYSAHLRDETGPLPPSNKLLLLSKLYSQVLAGGRDVQIRTFHGWFAALLANAPLAVLQQMNLPANYELLEDDSQARAQVWRPFYAVLVNDPAKKQDFEALVFEHGRFQIQKALAAALDKRVEFALADAQGVVDSSVLPFSAQFPALAEFAEPQELLFTQAHLQLFAAAAKSLGAAKAVTFSAKGVELQMALAERNATAMQLALLTLKNTPRKFGEKIVGIELVRQAQDVALLAVAATQQHSAWVYQQRMARLTRVLIQEYAELKRARGWVDMNDVERAASLMLGDPVLSGWVQQRLDANIKHLLIDEFQDTNPLQWQALLSWLSAYAGAGAGTTPSVFLVGDPKQSIYRFRRAEPQVFKAAQAFVRDGLGGALLQCDHTRRNARAVIATVNAVMADAMAQDGYDGFRAHTTDAQALGLIFRLPVIERSAVAGANRPDAADDGLDGTDSTVHDSPWGNDIAPWRDSLTRARELPEETLRNLEARQAAAWIAQHVVAGVAPQDIMVLSRKRASLGPMLAELRAVGVAAHVGEKTDLMDCCEVQDVVALLDALVSPQHDLSLARALKSPVFGLGDEVLVQLALAQRAQADSTPSWFDLLCNSEHTNEQIRGQSMTLSPSLLRWKGWIDSLPPHDALQAIYTDGDLLARFAVAAPAVQRDAVLANLKALLAMALNLGGGRFSTPYGFVRTLKSGGARAPAATVANAVRLLTVHGAKGLEADLVLMLDTDTPARKSDTMGVLVDWPGESATPRKLVFLASESQPPVCAEDALQAEVTERAREEINALYVAMTRAKTMLAISSIEPYGNTDRSWWARLQPLATPTLVDVVEPVATQTAATQFSLKELPGWELAQQASNPKLESNASISRVFAEEFAIEVKANDESNVWTMESESTPSSDSSRVGQAMHRLLQWGYSGVDDATDLQAVAVEFELNESQTKTAANLATRIRHGEGAWAWSAEVLNWQRDEVELIHQGQTLRLDRLVRRSDTGDWWVLDYKSTSNPLADPALVAQLQTYRQAVQTLYPTAQVHAAFLTGDGRQVRVPA